MFAGSMRGAVSWRSCAWTSGGWATRLTHRSLWGRPAASCAFILTCLQGARATPPRPLDNWPAFSACVSQPIESSRALLVDRYAGIFGSDFGVDKEVLAKDMICLADGCTQMKEIVTGFIVSAFSGPEAWAGYKGMGAGSPSFVDPDQPDNAEAWAAAAEVEMIEGLELLYAPAAEPPLPPSGTQAPAPTWDDGVGVGVGGAGSVRGAGGADTMTVGSDASAHEIASLRSELQRRESRSKMHESEVLALKAELEAAKAIASAQMEELRGKMQQEAQAAQQAALSTLREEMQAAQQQTTTANGHMANGHANGAAFMPPSGMKYMMPAPLQLPDDQASGASGVAMASAQMLLQQASAAANVIASLSMTLREFEGKTRVEEIHHLPASPSP